MAVLTAPTIDTLITEAFTVCGIASPSAAQVDRARNHWFPEVLTEIQGRKKFYTIEETMVVIPQPYLQVYAMPSPLQRVLRMRFYRGTKTGTATAGGADTITIAAGTGNAQDRGRKLYTLSGTGAAQVGRITSVTGDVYEMSCDWGTAPTAGTTYMIADSEREISGPDKITALDGRSVSTLLQVWDFIEHNLRFFPALDDAGQYALEIDGVVDLCLVDADDPRVTRLLREWRNPIKQGLMWKCKEDQDDELEQRADQKFKTATKDVMVSDARKRQRGEISGFRTYGGIVRKY
jgi:hypothetical protein